MILFSANETQGIVRKAAIGAGYDIGVAEDLGMAAAWLCMRNFDGAKTVLQSIADGPSQIFTVKSDSEYLIFEDTQIATIGVSVLDIAASGELPAKIGLPGTDSPLLLLGLAGICALLYRVDITIAAEDGSAAISTDGTTIRGSLPVDGVDLIMTCQPGAPSFTDIEYSANTITTDAATLKILSKLAAKTYVPASDASREKGAGAGLTDND